MPGMFGEARRVYISVRGTEGDSVKTLQMRAQDLAYLTSTMELEKPAELQRGLHEFPSLYKFPPPSELVVL